MNLVSLVIPCYNESDNIPLLLERCAELFRKQPIEIVIVDNGSTDNTSSVLDELTSLYPFVTKVKVEENQGYGHGITEGLRSASGEILAWTHADMQTDPVDILRGLELFDKTDCQDRLFVKGRRYGRPLGDIVFTVGMAIFETILLGKLMWDINAQPTMFHRSFIEKWVEPPKDFSLDLYAYYMAKKSGYVVKRFPVLFDERVHGTSHWNVNFSAKYKFIKRTLAYSFALGRKVSINAQDSSQDQYKRSVN